MGQVSATSVQGLKLRPPTGVVDAPARLVDVVLGTPAGGVTVLIGPPGYGRTTVAACVAAATHEPVAWLSVDSMDDLPGRLLAHVEAAVAHALPPVAAGRSTRESADHPARWDALLDLWSSGPPSWLVLDDLHLGTDPVALRGLSYLAGRLPSSVRLLVTSRTDLPALTADLRSSSRFQVVDETSLSLTHAETLLAIATHGSAPGEPDATRLSRLCAGWPAAVSAVASHPGPPHETTRWLTGAGAEQLLSDWWYHLPLDWQDFLVGTAHLPRLHPELCDLTLGRTDSGAVLFDLVAAHAFLRPERQGDLTTWTRHPLLTALLEHRVGRQPVDAGRFRAVAGWAADHGDVDTRVRALVAAGDVDEATALVYQHEEQFLQQRRADDVLEWYRLLPEDAISDRAGLLLRQAWAAALVGDLHQARTLHGMLSSAVNRGPVAAADAELLGDEAALAAHLAMYEAAPAQVLADVRRAEEAFGDAWTRPVHQAMPVLKARALLWLGRADQAGHVVQELHARGGLVPVVRESALPGLEGSVAVAQGRVHVAHSLAVRALSVTDGDSVPGAFLGLTPALLCRGLSLIDLAEPEKARSDLLAAEADGRQEFMLAYEVLALAGLARLEWVLGDGLQSIDAIRRARHVLSVRAPLSPLVHHLSSIEAMTRITLGDAARAERLVAQLPPRPSTTLLAVRLAQLRRPGSGTARLERLVAVDPRTHAERGLLMASALVVRQPTQALRWLVDATDLAEVNGIRTLLVGATDTVLDLAREEARRSANDSLVRMLAVADHRPLRRRGDVHVSAGDRELLTLLPGRDSNDALAARLSVSVNTVKTRLRRLYTKLGVNSRDDAVRVAREHGLID